MSLIQRFVKHRLIRSLFTLPYYLVVLMVVATGCSLLYVKNHPVSPLGGHEVAKTYGRPMVIPLYDQAREESLIDSLRATYGQHKIIPEQYELQILLALSHYPELRDIHMRFVLTDGFIPLVSRPKSTGMFKPKDQWEYRIFISEKGHTPFMDRLLLRNCPFNAQIGVLGHELAHTVYYLDQSLGDVMAIGVNYMAPEYRANFERDTDRRAIDHGLGFQMLEHARHVREGADPEDLAYGDRFYLNDAQIFQYMMESPVYAPYVVGDTLLAVPATVLAP